MEKEALIVKHFKGTLTESEQLEFETLLKTNADFKAEVDEYRDIQQAFKLNKSEDLKVFLNNVDKKTTSKKTVSTSFQKSRLALVAIAACLIIGAFYFFDNTQSPDKLYASYFEAYPNVLEPIVRGSKNENHNAFVAYENKDYYKAEMAFKTLIEKTSNSNLEFYYAMALLNQNKTHAAKIVLDDLKTKNEDFLPEIYWYSSLILLKQGDFELAENNLKKLDEINSDFKKAERETLLKSIK